MNARRNNVRLPYPTRQRAAQLALTLSLTTLAVSCGVASRVPAPVVERSLVDGSQPTLYTVRKYDTLYSIAWRHNLEYKALAAANGIESPYTVYPGQSIRLRATAPLTTAPRQTPAPVEPPPQRETPAVPTPKTPKAARPTSPPPAIKAASAAKPSVKPPQSTAARPAPTPAERKRPPSKPAASKPAAPKAPAPKPAASKPNAAATATWRKPVKDKPERRFGGTSKGFDYTLAPATEVRAAAAGQVVYAGPGLGGFRHLVIVKVSERYLVAYGINVTPKLKEGDSVSAGTVVAQVGSGGTTAGRFHFEIRDRGKPVDPSGLIGAS